MTISKVNLYCKLSVHIVQLTHLSRGTTQARVQRFFLFAGLSRYTLTLTGLFCMTKQRSEMIL